MGERMLCVHERRRQVLQLPGRASFFLTLPPRPAVWRHGSVLLASPGCGAVRLGAATPACNGTWLNPVWARRSQSYQMAVVGSGDNQHSGPSLSFPPRTPPARLPAWLTPPSPPAACFGCQSVAGRRRCWRWSQEGKMIPHEEPGFRKLCSPQRKENVVRIRWPVLQWLKLLTLYQVLLPLP